MLMYILFSFVVGLVSQLGFYFCVVGLFATIPIHYLAFAAAYTKNVDAQVAPPSFPAPVAASFAPGGGTPGAWPPPSA
jgi:hypothetical protein